MATFSIAALLTPGTATGNYDITQAWVPLPPGITALPAAPAPVSDLTYGEVLTPTALLRPYQESIRVDCVVKVQMTQRRLEYALTLPDQAGLMKVRPRVIGSQHVGTIPSTLVPKAKAALVDRQVFVDTSIVPKIIALLVDNPLTYGLIAKVKMTTTSALGVPPTLLLHFDGTNNSTTITDSSSNGWAFTASGNAKLTTTDQQFGTAQLTLDASANTYVQGPANSSFALGGGAFTIDFWVTPTTTSGSNIRGVFTFGDPFGFCLTVQSGYWRMGAQNVQFSMTTATAGERVHIAIVRLANQNVYFYKNGVAYDDQGLTSLSNSWTENQLTIGRAINTTNLFGGTIDEFRYIKGTAIWSGESFTPPVASY